MRTDMEVSFRQPERGPRGRVLRVADTWAASIRRRPEPVSVSALMRRDSRRERLLT